MADHMTFPKTVDDFIKQYSFKDEKQEYTNGAELIPVFRVKQMMEHYIANGVTVQQWIPVTEKLPTREDANETESILAIHKADGYVGRWIWDIVARHPKEFTHWMPLPQPPKED